MLLDDSIISEFFSAKKLKLIQEYNSNKNIFVSG